MSEYPPTVDWSRILKEIQANIETAYRAGLQAGRESANIAGDTERKAVALLDEATVARGIIDCTTGTPIVRRVVGTLPVTADGVVAGDGALIFDAKGLYTHELRQKSDRGWFEVDKCFSTCEAALAARGAK